MNRILNVVVSQSRRHIVQISEGKEESASCHMLTRLCCTALQILYTGVVVYAPALALNQGR